MGGEEVTKEYRLVTGRPSDIARTVDHLAMAFNMFLGYFNLERKFASPLDLGAFVVLGSKVAARLSILWLVLFFLYPELLNAYLPTRLQAAITVLAVFYILTNPVPAYRTLVTILKAIPLPITLLFVKPYPNMVKEMKKLRKDEQILMKEIKENGVLDPALAKELEVVLAGAGNK